MIGPTKKERGLGGTALNTDWKKQAYHHAQRLQASLLRPLNRPAPVTEIYQRPCWERRGQNSPAQLGQGGSCESRRN